MDPSETDADEASYGQHKNRYKRENPTRPELLSILIGVIWLPREVGIETSS
jgi:hypothetical protein